MIVVSTVPRASSNSTRPSAGTIFFFLSRNKKEESPAEIASPCCSHCSSTPTPFTRVPLRLSRSRTWNLPPWPVIKQCLRETEGSETAIPFDASRPMVISASDRGIVESFKGPESTRSLGRTRHLVPLLIIVWAQIHVRNETVPLFEQIEFAIRSDSKISADAERH